MKAVIQRVTKAGVTINGVEKRDIGKGFVVLLGIGVNDTAETCKMLAEKILNLRIFPEEVEAEPIPSEPGLNMETQQTDGLSQSFSNDDKITQSGKRKFSRSPLGVHAEILIVSQFTLFGDCSKGRRPEFSAAARPEQAVPLYEEFIRQIKRSGLKTVTGEFAADMQVDIQNDGPVTIVCDTDKDNF